ncbi:MAG: diphthamide biosynthesis enzyme Dph2 [Candidatus Aenigmatarchaeota archaeon]
MRIIENSSLKEELENLIIKLKEQKFKKLFFQIPEGLKSKINEIKFIFEKEGFETIFSLEPTYGACDIKDEEAKRLGCDALIHIAHANFGVRASIPTFYIHFIFEVNEEEIKEILEKNSQIFVYNSYVIVSSLQYIKYVYFVKNFLEKLNKKVFIKKVLEYEAQILGCNVNAAKVNEAEAIIVISEGLFYPLGLIMEIDKPIIYIDLEKKEVKDISGLKEKYNRIIAWYLSKFKDSKKIGLLVSWKKGQIFYDVFKIKEYFEKMNKEVYIFAFDEISPEKLEGIDVDFLVNLACPRVFPDDYERYKIPILNYSIILKHFYDEKRNTNNSF